MLEYFLLLYQIAENRLFICSIPGSEQTGKIKYTSFVELGIIMIHFSELNG